jgi:hypothetical protein
MLLSPPDFPVAGPECTGWQLKIAGWRHNHWIGRQNSVN